MLSGEVVGVVCTLDALGLGLLFPAGRPRERLTQTRSVQPYGREAELVLSWVIGVACTLVVLDWRLLVPAVTPRAAREMLTQMRSVQL